MQTQFFHLKRPRRLRFYLAAAAGPLAWHLLHLEGAPAFLLVAFFMALMFALALRSAAAGMEIRDGRWTVFVDQKSWSVPLGEIGAVRVIGGRHRPRALWLRLRDGRLMPLPRALSPDMGALERALARGGIPLEA